MVGFSGVVGVAVVPSSRAHDGDAWWLVRLGVEVVVYNVQYIYFKKNLVSIPVFCTSQLRSAQEVRLYLVLVSIL